MEFNMKKFYLFQVNLSEKQYDNSELREKYLDIIMKPTVDSIRNAAALYEMVAEIDANDLDEVFEIGNIGPEKNIKRLKPMHSVSVGDVIVDNVGNAKFVDCYGFGDVSFEGI
jgi:hypothetical protein